MLVTVLLCWNRWITTLFDKQSNSQEQGRLTVSHWCGSRFGLCMEKAKGNQQMVQTKNQPSLFDGCLFAVKLKSSLTAKEKMLLTLWHVCAASANSSDDMLHAASSSVQGIIASSSSKYTATCGSGWGGFLYCKHLRAIKCRHPSLFAWRGTYLCLSTCTAAMLEVISPVHGPVTQADCALAKW